MLWEKESDSFLYIDILKNTRLPTKINLSSRKDNAESIQARIDGNKKHELKDINGAMELYNKSVCLAEKDSENLGLAYANRSACFFSLNMYDRCLLDIELAKSANYPSRLSEKLENRKSKCLVKQATSAPVLSIDADKKFPSIGDVLEIKKSEQYGRMITAKCDIEIGETVLIEEPFIKTIFEIGAKRWNRCTHCCKQKMNFIPCDNCSDVMFCREKCTEYAFHADECNMRFEPKPSMNKVPILFFQRSVIFAIKTFNTIEKLMDFVEESRLSDPTEIPDSLDTVESKYRAFLKLAHIATNEKISFVLETAAMVFHAIMLSELGQKFRTKASLRFLMHLTVQHCLIIRINGFCDFIDTDKSFGQVADPKNEQYEQEIFLLSTYFNHSCAPNVIKISKENLAVYKALLPIKSGDQLYIQYLWEDTSYTNKNQRKDRLESSYGFRCKCGLCGKDLPEIFQNDFDHDHDTAHIANLALLASNETSNLKLLQEIERRCIVFLTKHHPRGIENTGGGIFVLRTFGSVLEKVWKLEELN